MVYFVSLLHSLTNLHFHVVSMRLNSNIPRQTANNDIDHYICFIYLQVIKIIPNKLEKTRQKLTNLTIQILDNIAAFHVMLI